MSLSEGSKGFRRQVSMGAEGGGEMGSSLPGPSQHPKKNPSRSGEVATRPFKGGTKRRRTREQLNHITRCFLEIANRHAEMTPLLEEFVREIKKISLCGAVGIRILDEEGHIPYESFDGFSRKFYESESPLSVKSDQCRCINVIRGEVAPELPFYTGGGSFYMNGTTRFLATVSEEEKGRTRNMCHREGYESVALIPIRMGEKILGLIHLADKKENMAPKEMVEMLEGAATQLGTAIERVKTAEALHRSMHDLGERIKELKCLYGISKLAEDPRSGLGELLQGIVDLIPPGWQYPEITSARIILGDQSFVTSNFSETIWKQASDITVSDKQDGRVEVCYREERPKREEGPFLKEERNLLDAISERLGTIIERQQAKEALEESEGRYRILTEQVADGVTLIQEGRFLFANPAFVSMFGYRDVGELLGKRVEDPIFGEWDRRLKEFVESGRTKRSSKGIFRVECRRRDGSKFWVEGHHNVIKWKEKTAILATLRDITERKLKEIAVQEEADLLRKENIRLRTSLKNRNGFGKIIGKSPAMEEVYELIVKTSAANMNLVITGESGTGKELVAHAIHHLSDRREDALVAVNCGAIPAELLESEFFGYKKGAFTGAISDKHGYLDLAENGSLFLDEVGELSLSMQAKLLRALDQGGYMPLGSSQAKKTRFSIIAATNKDLMGQVRNGLMREDFFYRINVISIHLPPLRDRKEDIPLLIEQFLKSYNKNGHRKAEIPEKIIEAMYNYHWPGNVRELQNVLHRYLTLNRLDFMNSAPEVLPDGFKGGPVRESGEENNNLIKAVEDIEKDIVSKTLNQTNWNRSKAATLMGISRRALYRKMKNFEMI